MPWFAQLHYLLLLGPSSPHDLDFESLSNLMPLPLKIKSQNGHIIYSLFFRCMHAYTPALPTLQKEASCCTSPFSHRIFLMSSLLRTLCILYGHVPCSYQKCYLLPASDCIGDTQCFELWFCWDTYILAGFRLQVCIPQDWDGSSSWTYISHTRVGVLSFPLGGGGCWW